MRLTRDYVTYTAQTIVRRLIEREMIETGVSEMVSAKVEAAITTELSIEDRINDKVREVLGQYSEEMVRTGASYQEMFKKIKAELVRREKVVL